MSNFWLFVYIQRYHLQSKRLEVRRGQNVCVFSVEAVHHTFVFNNLDLIPVNQFVSLIGCVYTISTDFRQICGV